MKPLAIVLALAAAGYPAAADSGIRGPVTGFVFDARLHAIRPINGLPGAATLGAALPLPFAVRQAAVSARLDYALAVSDADGQVYLVRGLSSDTPAASAVQGTLADAGRVLVNAPGTAALVYSQASGSLQTISGLPDDPRAAPPVDVSAAGEIGALALSPDAARAALANAGEGAVYELSAGALNRLAATHGVSALAYSNGGRDLLFASQATNEIALIRGLDGNGDLSVLAGEGDGVGNPVGIQSVNGGREIWIANAASSTLLVLDMTAPGVSYNIPLSAAPTRCEPLDGNSLILLNDAGATPLLLADWARGRAVYFVPADQAVGQ